MRKPLLPSLAVLVGLITLAGAPNPAARAQPDAAAVPADAKVILSDVGMWRWRVAWRRPVVIGGAEGRAAVIPVERVPFTNRPNIQNLETAPPPAAWMQPDFDDADWPRSPAKAFAQPYFQAGVLCMRGRFNVTNPKRAKAMYVSLAYRGGVVVYLNGTEIARGDMPTGSITGTTAASPYPLEAWVDAQGKALDKRAKPPARDRSLGPVRIPADALVKGVNVLAVAVHRADYHPVAMGWFTQKAIHSSWRPIALRSVRLLATGGGVTPNVARPVGAGVYSVDVHHRLFSSDYGDAVEPLRPVRIVAAANGAFAGVVVLWSTKPLRGVRAKVTDLTQADGAGRIPASAIDVRYLLRTDGATRFGTRRRYVCFDALAEQPPAAVKPVAGGASQPIWLRVNVPADTPAGEYRGTVEVSAVGLPRRTRVPVELEVIGWTLPDPAKFRTHAGIYQSPTSVAMRYKVPMWSQRHWELLDRSFAILSRIGNDLAIVPVVDKTQFGNVRGMVTWVRKADGTWDYDFTVLDRYLAMVAKHLGVPRFVALQIWHAGGWSYRQVDDPNTVTVRDEKTGTIEAMQVPVFGSAQSKRFWTDALAAIRKRLAAVGMDDSRSIGILSDSTAPAAVLKMFAEIDPDLGWMRGCHGVSRARKPYSIGHGAKVVYHEHCYGMSIPDPATKIYPIFRNTGPVAAYFRSDFDPLPPLNYRKIAERALYQGKCGVGRMGLDFWEFPRKDRRGYVMDIYNRWPRSSCAQRRPTLMKLAWSAAEGPVPTVRFELLLEGLQEAEAMLFIADAAANQAGRLGADLLAECKRLQLDRINVARVVNGYRGVASGDYAGWQAASKRLYETAARVAKKLN